jgi:glycerophosphoryl diester phosphodiesterase
VTGRRAHTACPVFLLLLCASCAGAAAASAPTAPVALPFHVIAHRGASAEAPENTLPAFERALSRGVRSVELDVQLSRDGVVVLFHDDTLDEKTDLSGRVADHDAAALAAAEIGRWFDASHPGASRSFAGTRLTTLARVFARFGAAFHYHVEIKSDEPDLPARILELADAHDLRRHLTLTSFRLEPLRRARALDPELRIAWLCEEPGPERIDRAVRERFDMIAFPAAELDARLVARAHRRGLEIRAFRVKTPELMERAIRVGANGMTIDWPERLIGRLLEIWQAGGLEAPAAATGP